MITLNVQKCLNTFFGKLLILILIDLASQKATEEQMKVFKKDNNTVLAFVEEWFDNFESNSTANTFLVVAIQRMVQRKRLYGIKKDNV